MNALAPYRQRPLANFIKQQQQLSIFKNKCKQLTYLNKYNIIDTREYEKEKPNLSKIRGFLKEFVLLIKEGTKEAYSDTKWLFKQYKYKKHSKFTGFELREERRILYDMFKFVPFSAFLFIPAGEAFLPLYLLYFPNSVPSWFIFDHAWDAKIEKFEMKQKEAHGQLIHKLRDFLMQKGLSAEDFMDEQKYRAAFVKNKKDIDKQLCINKNFSSDDLIQISKFLGIDYISGTYMLSVTIKMILNSPRYLVNLLYMMVGSKKRLEFEHWIFNYDIKLNYGPFEYLKRGLLRYQINRHIKQIRKQDRSFFRFGMHDIYGHQITDFARERGITTISCYETLKVFMQNDWVAICYGFTNNQLVWYAMLQYDFLKHANQEFN